MQQEGRLRGSKEGPIAESRSLAVLTEDGLESTTIASSRKFSGTAGPNSESAFNPENGHSDAEEEEEDMAEEIASG